MDITLTLNDDFIDVLAEKIAARMPANGAPIEAEPEDDLTGGAAATKVAGLVASNTDASNSYTLQLVYNQGGSNSSGTVTGGTNYLLGSSNLPISAGNVSAAPPVNLLASASIPGLPVDATGAPYLYVNSGDFLCVAVTGTVASGKLVSVVGAAADY